jgi:hypothetical protein
MYCTGITCAHPKKIKIKVKIGGWVAIDTVCHEVRINVQIVIHEMKRREKNSSFYSSVARKLLLF